MPTTKPGIACLLQSDEERAEELMKMTQADAKKRWELYKQMAEIEYNSSKEN